VALGWLHWEGRYAQAVRELWRAARRYVFFDLRLLPGAGPDAVGTQRLALTGDWDGRTTVPYICAAWSRIAHLLLELAPRRVLAHGYWGPPAPTVIGVEREICFATFVLERAVGHARPEVALDLPLAWPAELRGQVEEAGPERLRALIGEGPG
jgi:hypothetical protein